MMQHYTHLLQTNFGFSSFRPGQLEAIQSVLLDKRHTFVVLPTSTGKTLIFQFITLVNRQQHPTGITLVISPLIALMVDQVAKWNREFLVNSHGQMEPRTPTSTNRHPRPHLPSAPVAVLLGSAQEDPQVEAKMLGGLYPVVYLAPEKLPYLPKALAAHVQCLVIDECHCVSEHGLSFRPAYRTIRPFFPAVTTLALTATAPPEIQADILHNLGLESPTIIRHSIGRPNLYLCLQPKRTRSIDLESLRALRAPQGRTVVFGTTRLECDLLARDLGPGVFSYHAGLSTLERAQTLESFVENTMLVATNCFGLGVDLSDIQTVIHYGLPRSLLAYVQECGRAGRDGRNATCVMFFSSSDISRYNTTERDVRLATEMLVWAKGVQCRHRTLRQSFGEASEPGSSIPCVWGTDTTQAGCDICRGIHQNPPDLAPIVSSHDIRLLLHAIATTGNHAGKRLPIDFLLGSRSKKVARFASCFGYREGRHQSRDAWMVLHAHLLQVHLLREVVSSRGYVVYKLTSAGRSILTPTEDGSLDQSSLDGDRTDISGLESEPPCLPSRRSTTGTLA